MINTLPAFAGPKLTTYQAKIIKPDGQPLEAASVNFKFTILDPLGTCILYSETYSAVNMSSTGGVISFSLGSGVKSYPVSSPTFADVFSNITPSMSCDAGGPVSYSPAANDIRKIVMQFHDGSGWQTLPAMNINAVPYAMYADDSQKLGGVSATAYVADADIPTCAGGQALFYNGTNFSCVAVGGGGVTSSTITAALGYAPADAASFTTVSSDVSAVSTTVFSVSSTVSSLANSVSSLNSSVAASFAAITNSQWVNSGTTISYDSGLVGIGTSNPIATLSVGNGISNSQVITLNALNFAWYGWYLGGVRTAFIQSTASEYSIYSQTNGVPMTFSTSSNERMRISASGSVGIGITNPTAKLHLAAGTATLAPLKFASGTLLASPQSGTVEYDGTSLYFTDSTNTRRTIATGSGVTSSSITTALGYTPASAASLTAVSSEISSNTANISAVSSTVSTLATGTAASFAAITSSQWATSGTAIHYLSGNIGVGTSNPTAALNIVNSADREFIVLKGAPGQNGAWIKAVDSSNVTKLLITPNSPMPQFTLGSSDTVRITSEYSGFGEVPNTGLIHASGNLSLFNGLANGQKTTVGYFNGTNMYSAFEIANVGSGFGNLLLMRSGGRVGIGTTNPAQTLDVSGGAQASRFYAGDSAFSSPSLTFTNNSNTGFYNASGNLGITVGGGLKGTWSSSSLAFNAGGAGPQIYFTGGNEAQPSYAFNVDSDTGMFNPNASGGSNELGFSTSGTEKIRILSTGYVGIGTSAPTSLLTLASGTSTRASLKLMAGTLLTSPQSGAVEYDGSNYYITNSTNTRRMVATVSGAGNFDGVSTITSTGNISAVPTGSFIVSSTTASTNPTTGALVVNGGVGIQGNTNLAADLNVSGTMRAAGPMGIGTTNPTSTLEVRGVLRVSSSTSSYMEFHPTADISALNPGTTTNTAGIIQGVLNASMIFDLKNNNDDDAFAIRYSSANSGSVDKVGMVFKGSGYMGLGTSNPTVPLDVSGTVRSYAQDSYSVMSTNVYSNTNYAPHFVGYRARGTMASPQYPQKDDGLLALHGRDAVDGTSIGGINMTAEETFTANAKGNSIRFLTASLGSSAPVERMRINTNGTIGIGVAVASAPLDIAGVGSSAENIRVRGKTAIEGGQMTFMDGTGTGGWEIDNYAADGFERLRFFRDKGENNVSEPFIINYTGYVGVNNTAPTAQLSVSSANNINAGANLANGIGAFRISDGTSISLLFDSNQIEQMDSANSLYLNHNSSASTIINYGGGNVGIGTTTPGGALEIRDNVTMLSNGSGAIFRITNPLSANSDYFQVGWLSEDNWAIMTADSGTHRNLVVTPWGGNLGVGNVNPTYKLDVSGDIRISGNAYRDGGAAGFNLTSDARLKNVIANYDRGLKEILDINTVIFKYKKNSVRNLNTTDAFPGVIAQQVQKVIPEAVNKEKDGFLTLETTPILWAMLNAIKEVYYEVVGVKTENAELKLQAQLQARKIQSLEEENAAVKERLDRLEKAIQQQNK